jgi:tetratricopeptide (TPR) repeat protein
MYRRALQKDRKSAEAWYRLGLVDARLGAWGEAFSAYQRAVELNPANTDAAAKLADLYFASYLLSGTHPKESLAEAKGLAKSLLQRDANSFDGLRLAGYVALVEKNFPEAMKDFEAANRVRPWQRGVVLTLCEILANGERAAEGEALARDMIVHDKQDGEIYDFLVRYYLARKRAGDAESILEQKIANNPRAGQYVIELARFYQFSGHGDKAEAALRRLTSDTRSYPDAWMLVGNYYLMSGDSDKALGAFSKGEAADEKNKTAYQKRSVEALLGKGQTADASRLAEEIAKTNPDDPEAIALRAVIAIQTAKPEQLQKAINDLGPLIGKYPNAAATPMLRYHLARAFVAKSNAEAGDPDQTRKVKDLDEARNQLEQAFASGQFTYTPARLLLAQVQMDRREYARVTQIADDVLKSEPGNLRARLLRTAALTSMGEYDKAGAELTQLLAVNPNVADAQLQLARVDVAQKKLQEAEGILEKWQATDPRAFMDLVSLKVLEGKYADAIQILNRQMSAHPGNEMLRFALANVQVAARKYDEAIASLRQMLDNSPNMPVAGKAEVYSRIAAAQERKGDLKAALATYTAASRLMPNDARPLVEIALIYDQWGRTDQASAGYESALKLDPENALAMNNLAYLKAQDQVDLDRALSLAQRARQRLPDNIDVQDTLALIYVRKNLTDEALRMMRDLVDKRPNNPVYHYHLALALYQKGDKPGAKKELSTALSLKPAPADQLRIRDLMGKIG